MQLRFELIQLLYVFLPLALLAMIARVKWYKPVRYVWPMVSAVRSVVVGREHISKKFFFLSRFITLIVLAFLIAKPQLVDVNSQLPVEGVDIALVLDVSGSMQFVDDKNDPRSRFQVAKDEAIRFIQKRENDALGLVIFGNDALSRAPITHDKQILKKILDELELGFIDADGTLLSRGMITGINRLKHSTAKSKIMILLTDGEPSPGDLDPAIPLKIAQELGIKIYTIGIGSEHEQYIMHPHFGPVLVPSINKELLEKIAHETGGQFFQAKNPQDMRAIYDTIDALEKTERETPIFTRLYDLLEPVLWPLLALLFIEVLLGATYWFCL